MQDRSMNTTPTQSATTLLYHTARIVDQGGSWSVESSQPAPSECEQHLPECTTEHGAMDCVQQPHNWRLVGVIDDGEGIYGVFAIIFEIAEPDATPDITPEQLRLLAHSSNATHSVGWTETHEQKIWNLTGHARRLSPGKIIVWSRTDEAGTSDVAVVDGDDAEQAAVDHAHMIAAHLDGRGVIEYVIAVVAKWESGGDAPSEVTEDTLARRLEEWIDGDGDLETVQVARALYQLI